MPTGFSSRRAKQSQITGKIGGAVPPQNSGVNNPQWFTNNNGIGQQQPASFAPPRDIRSAEHLNRQDTNHFTPAELQPAAVGGGYRGTATQDSNVAPSPNFGGGIVEGEVPKFGRRAKTVDPDAARDERARLYQEELRQQVEAARAVKENKKKKQREEDAKWEAQLQKERDVIKAKQDYDIKQESKAKVAAEEAQFGGPPKKGRRGGGGADAYSPNAQSNLNPYEQAYADRGAVPGEQQRQQQPHHHNEHGEVSHDQQEVGGTIQPFLDTSGNGEEGGIKGRRGQYRLPPTEQQKKSKDEAFQEELKEQMLTVQRRKEAEKAAREKADRDYDHQVEAWGQSGQMGMAWGVKANEKAGGGSGGEHNPNLQHLHAHQQHSSQYAKSNSSPPVAHDQPGGQQGHLPAFLQDEGGVSQGGGDQQYPQDSNYDHGGQQQQHHQQGVPSFLQDNTDYGQQQQPQALGSGGYGGGYGGQAPSYANNYDSSGGGGGLGVDHARDDIVSMLLEQKRQIQDLHNQQQVVVNTIAGGGGHQPIPVPAATVAMPPPAHRTYQANYQGVQGQALTTGGGAGGRGELAIHSTQVYVDNPDNLLQRFLKEEDRGYSGGGVGGVPATVMIPTKQSPTGPPSYSGVKQPRMEGGVGVHGGGSHYPGGGYGDSPERQNYGGRGRNEMMESALSLGGDVEFVEGGGELTTDQHFVPLTKPKS